MRKLTKKDIEQIEELRELVCIPANMGEQFINVDLTLPSAYQGTVRFGFNWKCNMGEYHFGTLDEAIEIVKNLRKRANL